MRAARVVALAGAWFALSGCYHQVVQSGRPAGSTVIERPWTPTWIFGLVAAPEIDVRQQCPSGVATVETKRSVPNALAGIFTLGIYTPVHVRISCASGSASLSAPRFEIAADATPAEREMIWTAAMLESERTGAPVTVRF